MLLNFRGGPSTARPVVVDKATIELVNLPVGYSNHQTNSLGTRMDSDGGGVYYLSAYFTVPFQ